MEFPYVLSVANENETAELALKFKDVLQAGDVVTFVGDLGTGKTFFVKSLLTFFGVEEVTSPTFSIVNTYRNENFNFYHFDFYRIKREAELLDIGFDEYLMDSNSITFIEWADLFESVLPQKKYIITIKYLDSFKREFRIEKL